jgi:hypothetical protein
MHNIICHIPHASVHIPDWSKEQFLISEEKLMEFALKMQDKYILEIFDFVEKKMMFPISRIIVDVERYKG